MDFAEPTVKGKTKVDYICCYVIRASLTYQLYSKIALHCDYTLSVKADVSSLGTRSPPFYAKAAELLF